MRWIVTALILLIVAGAILVLSGGGDPRDIPPRPDEPPSTTGTGDRHPGSTAEDLPPIPGEPEAGARSETGTVTGVIVTPDGRRFSGPFRVRVLPAGSADLPEVSSRSFEAADGAFSLTAIPPGRYVVAVVAAGESGTSEAFELRPDRPVGDLEIVVRPVGSISGVVLRADTGEPVSGARIESRKHPDPVAGTFSGADGRFLLVGLTPRKHVLGVTANGFARSQVEGVEVEAGWVTSGVVVRLGVGGTIRGIVFGPDGKPSPGAEVVVVPVLEGLRIIGDFGAKVVADESGAYRIDHLTPGKYRVRRPAGGTTPIVMMDSLSEPEEDSDPPLEVGEGEVVTFDLRSDLTGEIRGTMRSTTGSPLRRQVSLLGADGQRPPATEPPRFALPDEEGKFVLPDLPPGEHVLEADGVHTPVTVRAGRTTEVEIVFETGRIEGVVQDEAGAPMAKAMVWWDRPAGSPLRVQVQVVPRAETDADGRFVFTDVTAGRYRLRANMGPASTETEVFGLRPGEVRKGVVIRLERPVEVQVVVLDGAGAPIAGVPVQLSAQEGTTDADGVARFCASPGTHPIVAGTPPDAIMRVVRIERSGSQTFTIKKK